MTAPFSLTAWAAKWRIAPEALADLRATLNAPLGYEAVADSPQAEAAVQARIRLVAPERGVLTFRNNVGALLDARGVPVRYGLANDSAALNKRIKSADLIGIRRVVITPGHVGQTIGQFWSREVKRPGWTYSGTDREPAQLAWAALVTANGGDAGFATHEGEI